MPAHQALLVPQVNRVLTCVTETLQARRLLLFDVSGLLTTAWFCALAAAGPPAVRNAFRRRCALAEAEVVAVTVVQQSDLEAAASAAHPLPEDTQQPWYRRIGKPAAAAAAKPARRRVTVTCPVERNEAGDAFITVMGVRRVFDASLQRFAAPFCAFHAPQVAALHAHAAGAGGLSDVEASRSLAALGANAVDVPVTPPLAALAAEFMQVFYVYQFACCQLWAVDYYVSYAYALAASILLTGLVNVWMARRTQLQLRQMAAYDAPVWARRGSAWRRLRSAELAPGDVVRLEPGRVPADVALLTGRPAVDESMLTGEALPVTKTPLPPADAAEPSALYDAARHKRHTLFAGTTVLHDDACAEEAMPLAVVVATGLSTSKGQLMQTLMFPAPLVLRYEQQALYILLGLLAYSLVTFGVTVYFYKSASPAVSIMFGLESVATVIPPLLPLALAVGQSVASDRLRRRAIFCLSLPRIALAGMVDVFCFDKTGTLTREGLDFAGVHPIIADGGEGALPRVGELVADAAALPALTRAACAAATSVARLGDRFVGNEVDCKLFAATGWAAETGGGADASVLLRSPCGTQRLELLRRFEFDHGLQCMSAVVRDAATPGGDVDDDAPVHARVFVKGSYEAVRRMAVPGSVPAGYDDVTAALAKQGAYVLALATRDAGQITRRQLRSWGRSDAECHVTLLGLLVFRNELKPDTADALRALAAGGVACVMITGDNAYTGVHVARGCGLLAPGARVALAEEAPPGAGALLAWRDVDSGQPVPESELLAQLRAPDSVDWRELALSGGAFAAALRAGTPDAMAVLLHARVLARMSPDQKTAAVSVLKAAGLITGMCGDGGNDCGALRAAHVGVALSEAEASLVSPFASKRRTVAAVVDVLQEGRASLATGFASFKYMVQYGLLYSVLNLCVNFYQGSLSQAQYLVIDMAIILPLSAVSTLAGPAARLHVRKPPASLLGPATLLSLLGQFALCCAFSFAALGLLAAQPWYTRRTVELADPSRWWLAPDSAEVTVLFLTAVHQFAASAVAFSLGSVFRAGAHTNWAQNAAFAAHTAAFGALVLAPAGAPARWFHLVPMPRGFRVRLWLLLQVQTAALLLWEKVLLDGPIANAARRAWARARGAHRPSYLRLPSAAA
jgi:cation-transporting ATPase 13A3/4/5